MAIACELLGGKPCWRDQQRKEGFCGTKDAGHYSPNQSVCHIAAHHAETNGLTVYSHGYRTVYFGDPKGAEAEFKEGHWPGDQLPPKKEAPKPAPVVVQPAHSTAVTQATAVVQPPRQETTYYEQPKKKRKKSKLSYVWNQHIKPSIKKNAGIMAQRTLASIDRGARHYVPKSILSIGKLFRDTPEQPVVKQVEQRPAFPTIPFDSGAVVVAGQAGNIKSFLRTKMNAAEGLDPARVLATALVANKAEFEQIAQTSRLFLHRISGYQIEADNPITRVEVPKPGEQNHLFFIEDLTEVFQPGFDAKTRDHIIQLLWSQKNQPNPSLLVIATVNLENPHLTDEMKNYIRSLYPQGKILNI